MSISDKQVVNGQYATSARLNTRISIHEKYSRNKQPFGEWIVSRYDLQPGERVLELGCGTGSMWQGVTLPEGCRVTLTDYSAGMLETARENTAHLAADYAVVDVQQIPYEDASFDVVIANMMLYHVPDIARALREIRRVLTSSFVKEKIPASRNFSEISKLQYQIGQSERAHQVKRSRRIYEGNDCTNPELFGRRRGRRCQRASLGKETANQGILLLVQTTFISRIRMRIVYGSVRQELGQRRELAAVVAGDRLKDRIESYPVDWSCFVKGVFTHFHRLLLSVFDIG